MLAINEILQGRYRIVRRLGQGGMGAIYVAEDSKRFGKLVALKEILLDLDKISDEKQRKIIRHAFEREAKLLTQLENDAFPQVIEYFLETDRQFLVMELIHGEDLGEMFDKRRKPFDLREVLKWADQLLDALDYLHTLPSPIIHRDIKPQNIKLTAKGKIKLLDFGVAKGEDGHPNLTITNQTFIGATLHYSPIEQLFRVIDQNYREFIIEKFAAKAETVLNQNPDARSDLYALGATLYHLLTAQLPVDALKRTLVFWAGKPDPLPNSQQLNPQIPAEISEWLSRSMAIERGDRFASALEMQKALQEILANEKRLEQEAKEQKWLKEKEELQRRHALQLEQIEEERQHYVKLKKQSLQEQETLPDPILEKDTKAVADTQPSVTQPSIIEPIESENYVKQESFSEAPSGKFSTEFTAPSYITDDFPQTKKEKIESEIAVEKQQFVPNIAPKKKNVWILPIAMITISLFVIVVTGRWMMLDGSNNKNTNKSSNAAIVVPTVAPSISSTVSPSVSPTVASSPLLTPRNSDKPKSRVTPLPDKTARKTPKPNLPKDLNCVYTNSCR